jgi:hypothetical protein
MRYFQWQKVFEKNNCILVGLNEKKLGETCAGVPLLKERKRAYVYPMDDEYKKNVRLTDSLANSNAVIVASPRLRDFLTSRLGDTVEALPVHIKDHKGRIASKDYSIINVLDVQDGLAVDESTPLRMTIDGETMITAVRKLVLRGAQIASTSRLFRLAEFKSPILLREDLANEIQAEKFDSVAFTPVTTI